MTDQLTMQTATAPADTIAERAATLGHVTERIGQDPDLPAGVSPRRSLQEALKFLEVAAGSTEPVTPSAAVDVAWHHFILFTRDYMDYCATHLGRYIHHVPDDATADDDATTGHGAHGGYLRTRQLVAERFGEPDPTIWPDEAALATCESEGNCTADCTGDCKGS